jgi:predicted transcriptional regulator
MVETAAQPDIEIIAEIVSAYVSNNAVPVEGLPDLIASVAAAVRSLSKHAGKKFKSIKRHLSSRHGMTPDEYRAKWNLPADYPMVAPSYTAARSHLAKKIGLGLKRSEKPKRRGPNRA